MCIIPYGTQMGEISFCAYNTGIGWRNIVEKMLQNATVAEWYKEHGRHAVYAKGQDFPMPSFANPLLILLKVLLELMNARQEVAISKTSLGNRSYLREASESIKQIQERSVSRAKLTIEIIGRRGQQLSNLLRILMKSGRGDDEADAVAPPPAGAARHLLKLGGG